MHAPATFISLCHETVWLLADAGLQGLALLILTALAARLMRRKSAAARHLIWALAMAALLLMPLVSMGIPQWHLPLLPQDDPFVPLTAPETSSPVAQAPSQAPSASAPPPSAPPEPAAAPPTEPAAETLPAAPFPWTAAACLIWLAGALVVALPHLAGMLAVRRLARRARPLEEGAWNDLAGDLMGTLSLRRPIRLLRAEGPVMPMTWGLWKTTLLLPQGTEAWSEDQRRTVLLHELAHAKRHDCLTQAMAGAALALHWANPLAWMAIRRLRLEQERACDDLVLTAVALPYDYAGHLVQVARAMRNPALASTAAITMARKGHLEGRIRAILDAGRNRKSATRWALALGIPLMLAAVALVSAVTLAAQGPPQPTLEVHRYFRPGDEIWLQVNQGGGEWRHPSGRAELPQVLARLDGADWLLCTRISPLGAGGLGFPLRTKLPSPSPGMDSPKPPLSPGKHRLSLVFTDVPAIEKDNAGRSTTFPEITSNEIEFEIVDKLPEDYYRPVYEEGWEEVLREKLLKPQFMPRQDDQGPGITIGFAAGLPFNLACEASLQQQGSPDRIPVGSLGLCAGADNDHSFHFSAPGIPRDLGSGQWCLILTPSQEAAARNPGIRRYYGREFTGPYMKLAASNQAVTDLINSHGATQVTHQGPYRREREWTLELDQTKGSIPDIVQNKATDGGGLRVNPNARSKLLLLQADSPAQAMETIRRQLPRLQASTTTRLKARPGECLYAAVLTDGRAVFLFQIDTDPNGLERWSWWRDPVATASLAGESSYHQVQVVSYLGPHGSAFRGNSVEFPDSGTYLFGEEGAYAHISWELLGKTRTGRRYRFTRQFPTDRHGNPTPNTRTSQKVVLYTGGTLAIFEEDNTWLGLEETIFDTTPVDSAGSANPIGPDNNEP